jgi:glycosyltransferase involved in cell wall biosynthesis
MDNQKIESRLPLVSIILPVYNGMPYLESSVKSILTQTYRNFELIIINDGSKDNSMNFLRCIKDSRIRLFEQENMGLAATLNKGISYSKGEFIARHDQDDISLPSRLEKQVAFLINNHDYALVGTWASIINNDGETGRAHLHPAENIQLQFELLFDNPFVHSSVMLRKSILESVGLYSTDKNRQPPEDYELWSRIARHAKIANIPEILHLYREVPSSMSRTGINPFLDKVIDRSIENLTWVNKNETDETIDIISALAHKAYYRIRTKPKLIKIFLMLLKLSLAVKKNSGESILKLKKRFILRCFSIMYSYKNYKLEN